METRSQPLPPDVVNALRQGHKIEAIKRLRQAAGLDLTQAKQRIDEYERTHASSGPRLSPGEMPRTSHGLRVFVVAALAAFVAAIVAKFF